MLERETVKGEERRELIHFNVTASPTSAWIWRQLLEATPLGRQPTFLIHDRDAVYGGDFYQRLTDLGIAGVRTPARAPTTNGIGERIVRTIRTECLDRLIVISERHLRSVLAEFADYSNHDRPASQTRAAESYPRGRAIHGSRDIAVRPGWLAPRLRSGCLNADGLLPPFTSRKPKAR